MIFGITFIVVGVILILYAQHALHHQQVIAQTKPFFDKVHDFFIDVGNWFRSTAVKKPPVPNTTLHIKITLWAGVVITVIGALMLIFCKRKND